MKTLILFITLIFSVSVSAQNDTNEQIIIGPETDSAPKNLEPFILKNVLLAATYDLDTHRTYTNLVYLHGDQEENMKLSLKFAGCFILWNTLDKLNLTTGMLTPLDFRRSAWRALQSAKIYVDNANGDAARVETFMIPGLMSFNHGFNDARVVQCALLDAVTHESMSEAGVKPIPPEGYIPRDFKPSAPLIQEDEGNTFSS